MEQENKPLLVLVKIICMIFMFSVIAIFGTIPIRLAAFQSNKVLLAFSSAFSGGLFFAVGIIHLLPEASKSFDDYFYDPGLQKQEEHFPFAFLITTLSFAFVLLIEKIAVRNHHDHHQSHEHSELSKVRHSQDDANSGIKLDDDILSQKEKFITHNEDNCTTNAEQNFRDIVSVKLNIAKRISIQRQKSQGELQKKGSIIVKADKLTPYILQFALGVHAIFEGLAIGIERKIGTCLGLAIAVACHKWAEGLTLGLAFKQAGIDQRTATIMILIQAFMNPMGIGLGWVLSESGPLVTGIFYSISAGTFIYISTIEIIVQEFNIARFKWCKYFIFLLAIGFVSSIWFIEQLTE